MVGTGGGTLPDSIPGEWCLPGPSYPGFQCIELSPPRPLTRVRGLGQVPRDCSSPVLVWSRGSGSRRLRPVSGTGVGPVGLQYDTVLGPTRWKRDPSESLGLTSKRSLRPGV